MFPTIAEYNTAIQQQGSSIFRTLSSLSFIPSRTVPFKIYTFGSGSYAVVFKAKDLSKEYAIRCFISAEQENINRYRSISNYLKQLPASWIAPLELLENEININGQYYPVVKMDWIDGLLLNEFVKQNLYNNTVLADLQHEFFQISQSLENNKIGHGDIQCGNIIVTKNATGKITVKLVDYDGMYIPEFSHKTNLERGRSEFQHPQRALLPYNEQIDRFSLWVTICALEALKHDKTLWLEVMQGGFNTLDNMLFTGNDFINMSQSQLVNRLQALNKPELNFYLNKLKTFCNTAPNLIEAPILFNDISIEGKPSEPPVIIPLVHEPQKPVINPNEIVQTEKITETKPLSEPILPEFSKLPEIKYPQKEVTDSKIYFTSNPSGATVYDNKYLGTTPFTLECNKGAKRKFLFLIGTTSKEVKHEITKSYTAIHVDFYEPIAFQEPKKPQQKTEKPTEIANWKIVLKVVAFSCVGVIIITGVLSFYFGNGNNKPAEPTENYTATEQYIEEAPSTEETPNDVDIPSDKPVKEAIPAFSFRDEFIDNQIFKTRREITNELERNNIQYETGFNDNNDFYVSFNRLVWSSEKNGYIFIGKVCFFMSSRLDAKCYTWTMGFPLADVSIVEISYDKAISDNGFLNWRNHNRTIEYDMQMNHDKEICYIYCYPVRDDAAETPAAPAK